MNRNLKNSKDTRFRFYRNLIVLILVTLTASELAAQANATVRGRIIDNDTAEPVYGVSIIVREAKVFAQTDFDGLYSLQLPPGKHTIVYQAVGFDTITRIVTLAPGQTLKQDFVLGVKVVEEEEVLVEGRSVDNTESAILAKQKKAASVSDGVSAEAIGKSPDSSAGDVLKRVTGISLIDDRFVFVRGLGERYSNTFLNDSLLPSPEPDKRVVPMDIFPAGLIKNIRVIKTFLPEDSGEFSGGLVKVETKEYPDKFLFKLGFGLGGNYNTTGKHFLSSGPRGGNEYLGIDSGRRDLPSIMSGFPQQIPFVRGNQFGGIPDTVINLGVASMNNDWKPKTITAPYDRSLSFSVGDTKTVGEKGRFGYMIGSSYKRKFRKRETKEFRYRALNPLNTNATDLTYLVPLTSQDSVKYNENVLLGNNFNLTFEPVPGQRLFSKTLMAFQQDTFFRKAQGLVPENSIDFQSETAGYINRRIMSQTFGGKHAIGGGQPHILSWNFNTSEAHRNQPDLKQSYWFRNSEEGRDPYRRGGSPDGTRFFSETKDIIKALSAKYEIPFKQWSGFQSKFKFGAMAQDRKKTFKSRTFDNRDISANSNGELWPVPGEVTFHPVRFVNGNYRLEERTSDNSYYDAKQILQAYFGQVDMPLLAKFRFIGGARYEDSLQRVKTYNPYQEVYPEFTYLNPGIGEIHNKDLLPSANFVWEATKKVNLRVAYTETVTRPDLRELSDFGFSTYFGEDRVFGNAELNRSYIHNYDFRWEWYLTASEYVGAGVFYKQISEPIETIGQPVGGASTLNYTFANADYGTIRGVEFDARKDIGRFRLEANLFFIRSRVEIMSWFQKEMITNGIVDLKSRQAAYSPTNLERPLQGQSDFVYNIKAGYFFNDAKTVYLGLFYNIFGDRIEAVGAAGAPDTIEKSAGILDLVYQHTINDNFKLKGSIKNILDTRFKSTVKSELFNQEFLYRSYRKGVDYSFSMNYTF